MCLNVRFFIIIIITLYIVIIKTLMMILILIIIFIVSCFHVFVIFVFVVPFHSANDSVDPSIHSYYFTCLSFRQTRSSFTSSFTSPSVALVIKCSLFNTRRNRHCVSRSLQFFMTSLSNGMISCNSLTSDL